MAGTRPSAIAEALVFVDEIANRFPIADEKYEALEMAQSLSSASLEHMSEGNA